MRGRTVRAAAAGITAAAVWVAVEPLWRRAFGGPHTELRLVGRMLAPEAAWRPVGLAVHLMNGATFGVAFDRLAAEGGARRASPPSSRTTFCGRRCWSSLD